MRAARVRPIPSSAEIPSVISTYNGDGGYFDTLKNDITVAATPGNACHGAGSPQPLIARSTMNNAIAPASRIILMPIVQMTCWNRNGSAKLKPNEMTVSSSTISHAPRVSRKRVRYNQAYVRAGSVGLKVYAEMWK